LTKGAPARGDVPVDERAIVAVGVLAHLVELDAGAAEHGAVAAGHDRR
jgi:hypothetical protein